MLRGAAAEGNIVPSDSFFSSHNIQGFAASEGKERLAVRALVFKTECKLLLIICFEAGDAAGEVFKQRLAFRYGISETDILTFGLHNHALYWGKREKPIRGTIPVPSESELEYEKRIFAVTVDTIDRALRELREVKIGFSSKEINCFVNRVDPGIQAVSRISLIKMQAADGKLIAALAGLPCHEMYPRTHRGPEEPVWVNAGIPGRVIGMLKKSYPEAVFALANTPGADQKTAKGLSDSEVIGKELIGLLEETDCTESQEHLSCSDTVLWLNDTIPLKIRLFLIGQIAVLGMGGEIYSDIGERIIKNSPYKHTMVITSTERNHAGYVVSDRYADQNTFMTKDIAVPGNLENTIYSGIQKMWEAREWEL